MNSSFQDPTFQDSKFAGPCKNACSDLLSSGTRKRSSRGRRKRKETVSPGLRKPKRCLTAYNIFYQHEREATLLELPMNPSGKPRSASGKIAFIDLVRNIALKWKALDTKSRKYFEELAVKDRERYAIDMAQWRSRKRRTEIEAEQQEKSTSQSDVNKSSNPVPMPVSRSMVVTGSDEFLPFQCSSRNSGFMKMKEFWSLQELKPSLKNQGHLGSMDKLQQRNEPQVWGGISSFYHVTDMRGPKISDLISKLDAESISFLVETFTIDRKLTAKPIWGPPAVTVETSRK